MSPQASALPPYEALARFYDELSSERSYERWMRFVVAVLRRYGLSDGGRILDVGCGTGRLSRAFAELGHPVVGVDHSAAMLAVASEVCRGLEVELVQQDLRRLDLGPEAYDAAVCLCDVLNYMASAAELGAALAGVSRHLRPGGLFLFDLNTEWKLAEVYGQNTYAEHREDFSYIWENDYDEKSRRVCMHLAFFVRAGREDWPAENRMMVAADSRGAYVRFDEVHEQTAFTADEVLAACLAAGLSPLAYGSELEEAAGRPAPDPIHERTFYLARKPGR